MILNSLLVGLLERGPMGKAFDVVLTHDGGDSVRDIGDDKESESAWGDGRFRSKCGVSTEMAMLRRMTALISDSPKVLNKSIIHVSTSYFNSNPISRCCILD